MMALLGSSWILLQILLGFCAKMLVQKGFQNWTSREQQVANMLVQKGFHVFVVFVNFGCLGVILVHF